MAKLKRVEHLGFTVLPIERFPTDPVWTIRTPLPATAPLGNGTIAIATVDPGNSLDKRIADHTNVFSGRFPEAYGVLVESRPLARAAVDLRHG